tara:strand:- start:546 stop:1142 length:597 start_codon:yes stop_codon:yes gene_type:complete
MMVAEDMHSDTRAGASASNMAYLRALRIAGGHAWPCGHVRNELTTHSIGDKVQCRVCRRRRWMMGFHKVVMVRATAEAILQSAPPHFNNNPEKQHAMQRRLALEPTNGLAFIELVKAVTQAFDITGAQLLGDGRGRHVVLARVIVSRILSERGLPAPSIGRLMRRDHSTILNQLGKFPAYASQYPIVMRTFLALRDKA